MHLTSLIRHGDHTHEEYSKSGLTYTVNARAIVEVSLEKKHLCIKLALADIVTSICFGSHVSMADTLMLLIKALATVSL